jgi:hypothetical protein
MINIVYPYIKSSWQELKYSLRSLEQYFQEDFNVYILSDECPEWIENINFIKTERYKDPHQDVANKYYTIANLVDAFVWMSDDIYFLKPTHLSDIQDQGYKPKIPTNASTWGIRINDAIAALAIVPEISTHNYCTHTPLYFESEKLKQLINSYPVLSGKISIKTLYFNLYNIKHKPLTNRLFKTNADPVKMLPEYRYLCHNDAGLTNKVKEYLQDRFNIPSKFEKQNSVVPILKIKSKKDDGLNTLFYVGTKKNYVYDGYDFTNKVAQVPKKLADFLVKNYPRTFSY